jgi:hypothetical protein
MPAQNILAFYQLRAMLPLLSLLLYQAGTSANSSLLAGRCGQLSLLPSK